MAFSIKDAIKTFSASSIAAVRGSALGIDIGTSSIKIVQLRKEDNIVLLESYGEIALGRYGDGALSPGQISGALMDLMGEVKISARVAGVSILSSSTLIFVVDMPTRDERQLKVLMPVVSKKYIPANSGEVMLDWFVISDDAARQNVFDTMNVGPSVAPKNQKILLAAIYKETVNVYSRILKDAGVSAHFYEIEASSGARASLGHGPDTVLMVDLGADSTKLYIVERNIVRVLHPVKTGGSNLTKALAEEMQWDLARAEKVKRELGLGTSPAYSPEENEKITQALTSELEQVVGEAQLVIASYREQQKKDVTQIILVGGGARMVGIENYLKTKLNLPVEIARPFNRTKGPIVLEKTLHDAGPIFANAIGLALRAIGM
ncbi:MAG: pilus assembly protein PilM [bacterium]|nr:pilus assembly protein PilM [bacterium]